MTVAKRKKSSKKRRRGRLTGEQKFQRAWQRVQNQQRKNDGLRDEIQAFADSVEQKIGAREQLYTEALYRSCQHLISFYPRKTLARWQRETLLDWYHECLMTISANPFSTLDLSPLEKQFQDIMESVHPGMKNDSTALHEEENSSSQPEEQPGDRPEKEGPQTRDMFEDLFAEFGQAEDLDPNADSLEDDPFDDFDPFEEFIRAQQAAEEQLQHNNRRLNQLLKGSSINKMFRKVARVLHPDREPDAETRKHKNRLMSELIEARDSNDIARLISFYTEHVGESPLAELGGDLDTATLLLQQQYEYLRDQEEDIIHENPRSGIIYERFHHSSRRRVQQAIDNHLAELEGMIANEDALVAQITTLKKLKPLLEQREAMHSVFDELDVEIPF